LRHLEMSRKSGPKAACPESGQSVTSGATIWLIAIFARLPHWQHLLGIALGHLRDKGADDN